MAEANKVQPPNVKTCVAQGVTPGSPVESICNGKAGGEGCSMDEFHGDVRDRRRLSGILRSPQEELKSGFPAPVIKKCSSSSSSFTACIVPPVLEERSVSVSRSSRPPRYSIASSGFAIGFVGPQFIRGSIRTGAIKTQCHAMLVFARGAASL